MKFDYQARTKDGNVYAGQIEASSREAAGVLLQKHGLFVTFLEEAKSPTYAQRIKIFERISQKDTVLFSRQLSILFKSKVPLIESLRVLSTQTKNLDFKDKIQKISEEVEGGTSFSKALARFPKLFSTFYVAMVKSGEVSGKLSEVLTYLANHLEREYHLASKTKGILIYPALIVSVIFIIMIVMVYFIIPQMTTVLESTEAPLPLVTKVVMAGAAFLKQWGWIFFILFILGTVGCIRYYFSEKGKIFFDKIFLKTPLLGNLLQMIYISRFAENLSTLVSGGLPIAQALETVGDIIGNNRYKDVILKTRDEVRKGEMISSVLSSYSDIFPPVFVQMVIVGEKTGTLDSTLMNIVDFYRQEVDRIIDNMLSILEPALIIFLGGIVGGMIFSILMPLYQTISI